MDQKRALLFAFDGGTGVGHLRRVANVSKALQGDFSCLIVTSQGEVAQWFVPGDCEYIHIPSWDSLVPERAAYWGRTPFLLCDANQALKLRKNLLRGIVQAYEPDLIIVDHLPLGMRGELGEVVAEFPCPKYLLTRGVLNESRGGKDLVLGDEAIKALMTHYRRVLAATDERVFNFGSTYHLNEALIGKIVHTGYVIEELSQEERVRTRARRGLGSDDIWAVASAGGGQHGEGLIEQCYHLAKTHRGIHFDIVQGPRSRLAWGEAIGGQLIDDNVVLHRGTSFLDRMHSSADLVITSGGYNSLLEALRGDAQIICVPSWKNQADEQYTHASKLMRFADIELGLDASHLPTLFEKARQRLHLGCSDERRKISLCGSQNIRDIICCDLRNG